MGFPPTTEIPNNSLSCSRQNWRSANILVKQIFSVTDCFRGGISKNLGLKSAHITEANKILAFYQPNLTKINKCLEVTCIQLQYVFGTPTFYECDSQPSARFRKTEMTPDTEEGFFIGDPWAGLDISAVAGRGLRVGTTEPATDHPDQTTGYGCFRK